MEINRIFDLMPHFKANFGEKIIFSQKESGQWRNYTTSEYLEMSGYFSLGLLASGLQPNDKVATITANRVEWNIADMGILQAGMIHVPIYPTISDEEYIHILNHSEAKLVFVADASLHSRLTDLKSSLEPTVVFYTFDNVDNASNWKEIIELGKKAEIYYSTELEKIKSAVKKDDLATIIYTSGTTGRSKGVMLSHDNLLSNAKESVKILHLNSSHRALSFLPLCHVFERMTNYIYQMIGVTTYYAENMSTIADNLKELKVDGFITVPRLLETVYDKIIAKGNALNAPKRLIFHWALSLALAYKQTGSSRWYNWQLKLADKLVYSKWRHALGGNIIFLGVGGAALQPRLERMFWAAKIPIFTGYGLTETSPIISVNYSFGEHIRFTTTGPILNGVTVSFGDDGEILCKGPNLMLGYYKDPEKTAEVIDEDGWFHTGDIGELVDGRFLKITDRKKEMFKTSNGKYIAPQVIENKFKESEFIQQAMVVGENEKFASAIISPDFSSLKDWCQNHKINFKDHKELIKLPKVLEQFQKEINLINKRLSNWEQIRKFKLVCDEWSQITGELSPTLKLKRKFLQNKYQKIIEAIYLEAENSKTLRKLRRY